jgi:hypothetical protein
VADRAELQTAEKTANEFREIATLSRLGLALGGELDTEQLVKAVTDAGVAITGAAYGAFLYKDASAGWTHYVSGAPPDAFVDFPLPQDADAFGSPFRGDVCRTDDLTQDPLIARTCSAHAADCRLRGAIFPLRCALAPAI